MSHPIPTNTAFCLRAGLHPLCKKPAYWQHRSRWGFHSTEARNTTIVLTILAYAAIIDFLGWPARNGGVTEKAMFVVNVVFLWMSAIWCFAYPALTGPAVLAAIAYLALLVVMTSSDLRVAVAVPVRQRPNHPHDER